MKKSNQLIKWAVACVLLSASATSCKKFLAEDPDHLVTIGNYYKTEEDAVAAVNSIYAYLNSTSTGSTAGVYHSTFWVTAGLASDEMLNNQVAAPQFDQLASFSHSSQNNALEEVWRMHYKTITIANIAISRIPGISMNAELRNRLVAEAKFLRGLMYFNLVRMYGAVPLIIEENSPVTPSTATTDAIHAQVIADLEAAAAVLPSQYDPANGRGRATKGAANALLAKVHLTLKQWDKAAQKAQEVINSNQYALWNDFADVFKLSSRGGKEAIFSVGFGDAGGAIIFWEVGQFQVRLLPREISVEGVQNAQGWQFPTEYLYNAFDADDRRREVTFLTEIHNTDGTVSTIRPYIQKYWDRVAEPKGNESSNDFPVLRYSDVLLIYAEANNELGNTAVAHEYINKVRKRARFDGTADRNAVPDYNGLSQTQFRDAVVKERMFEFVGEGQRWFDLARTGTLETLVPLAKPGVTPSGKHYLFPIPQSELDLNPNLEQNDGY